MSLVSNDGEKVTADSRHPASTITRQRELDYADNSASGYRLYIEFDIVRSLFFLRFKCSVFHFRSLWATMDEIARRDGLSILI